MTKPILGDDYLAGLLEGSASTCQELDEIGDLGTTLKATM